MDTQRLEDLSPQLPRGRLWNEYQIYVAAAEDLGWYIKTFDEWLGS